jgi:hypothetical protein
VEPLQPPQVGAEQHQREVGALPEGGREQRLVGLLGGVGVEQGAGVGQLYGLLARPAQPEEQVQNAPALGRDDGLGDGELAGDGLAHSLSASVATSLRPGSDAGSPTPAAPGAVTVIALRALKRS